MTDNYSKLVNNPIGRRIAEQVGLPQPTPLRRYTPGDPTVHGQVLLGAAPGGRLAGPVASVLAALNANVATALRDELRTAAADAGLDAGVFNGDAPPADARFGALVFDATGITDSTQLRELHAFFAPVAKRVQACGRVVVLGTPPESVKDPRGATAQRALEGFTRAFAKEVGGGATVQLVYVAPGAENQLTSTLRFLLSARSAYVSAQVVRIGKANKPPAVNADRPLEGKVALVTGASRGIGAAIAQTLARDGAHVVGLDIPAQAADLETVSSAIGGSSLTCDITTDEAPQTIAQFLNDTQSGVDIVVHNAGVTQDRTLARMKPERWDLVLDINLSAEERITDALLTSGALKVGGRIVCVSSIAGIAGNKGQTNYATSKAGVIGMVQSLAPVLAKRKITINAVAPGFIETQMTAAVPIAIREAGRRMNSMSQGGLPVDVAEGIAWFAAPDSGGLTGNVVRVCGQSLLGA